MSFYLFSPVTKSEKLTAHVYGVVGGVAYPYPLPNNNACETEDIDCPIQEGKIYDVENTFTVRDNYPPVSIFNCFLKIAQSVRYGLDFYTAIFFYYLFKTSKSNGFCHELAVLKYRQINLSWLLN